MTHSKPTGRADAPPNGHRSIEEPVGDEDTDADLARIMAADHCGGDVDDVTVM